MKRLTSRYNRLLSCRLFINFFIHQSNFTKNGEIKPAQPKQRKENPAMKCQMGVSERLTCLIET